MARRVYGYTFYGSQFTLFVRFCMDKGLSSTGDSGVSENGIIICEPPRSLALKAFKERNKISRQKEISELEGTVLYWTKEVRMLQGLLGSTTGFQAKKEVRKKLRDAQAELATRELRLQEMKE